MRQLSATAVTFLTIISSISILLPVSILLPEPEKLPLWQRITSFIMLFSGGLAAALTIIAFIIDVSVVGILENKVKDNTGGAVLLSYGNAVIQVVSFQLYQSLKISRLFQVWLTLVAAFISAKALHMTTSAQCDVGNSTSLSASC
jgi:hypothetical protein